MPLIEIYRKTPLTIGWLLALLIVSGANGAGIESAEKQSAKPMDAELAIKQFKAPENFKIDLFASDSQLQNPVAFTFDEQGRVFVAETFRLDTSTYDIRGHMNMYYDDLASRTVADRVAMMRKYLGNRAADLAVESEVVQVLEDQGGTGRINHSQIYAKGFSTMLDGVGAGVLAHKGTLYYTDIPNLWMLQGANAEGQAAMRKSLSFGYGVHFSFTGHDLHGLRIGMDGKLYFSSGDRAFNVTTREGKVLDNSESGGVLRCNLDGSDLEIFATGLRNPQELAFDDRGDLFTCDNNCDHGDAARLVYVAEGGDSGWRTAYQFSETTAAGLWNSENLWHTNFPGQSAYIVPPIDYIADGPSGLSHYPGTGFPAMYQDYFFLCDFRGASANSGVHTFAAQIKGAGFEMVDHSHFFWGILGTDVQFGPDGGMYVSDWVRGWAPPGLGRLYRLYDPAIASSPLMLETKKLIAEGMEKRTTTELKALLGHADQRVRQEAQFELADRALARSTAPDPGHKSTSALVEVALEDTNLLARLHGVWGVGQVGRSSRQVMSSIVPLLNDKDAEVRAQTAKVMGEAKFDGAFDGLTKLLGDANLRVRYFAAESLGKIGKPEASAPLVEMLRANADRDVFLRHAGIMGLLGTTDRAALLGAAKDDSRAVRIAALVVMRRRQMPEVAAFLKDPDQLIIMDAARAINDVPITEALPELAALIQHPSGVEMLDWRIINANERAGRKTNASALAGFAARNDVSEKLRSEALRALGEWAKPFPRDRVTGQWRPLPAREGDPAAEALVPVAAQLITTAPDSVKLATVLAARTLAMRDTARVLFAAAIDTGASPLLRVAALDTLAGFHDARLPVAVKTAQADKNATVRAAGNRLQSGIKPAGAADALAGIVENGKTLAEKQSALATLGAMDGIPADTVIAIWLDKLIAGKVPREIQLDLLEAAGKRSSSLVKDDLKTYEAGLPRDDEFAGFRETLYGGDAAAGKKIFFERPDASCVRCHKINGEGGVVGPDLTGIMSRHNREFLLESILFPNKQIAAGFESVMVVMKTGETYAGVVKSQDENTLSLFSVEDNALVKLRKNDIKTQIKGQSPMPEGIGNILSKEDLRNLVEFLATAK